MNFFKSMLSDDPEPENMDNNRNFSADCSRNHQQTEKSEAEYTDSNSDSSGEVSGSIGGGSDGLWSFGDLVKTLTTRSESVLETYRRDLKEFGSGLRRESDLFREVANRAVKDLPTSIEVGASAIDGVLKSTVEIISQGTDVLLEPSDIDDSVNSESVRNSRVYNRFDSQLNAIQTDVRTYCDDPEDLDDYCKWKLGFVLSDRGSEIEKLIGDSGSVEEIYKKVVPNQVDDASFWCRYFYRVYKLKQQEYMRAHLVRRSLTVDDEEELSWDVDDDEEETRLPEIEKKQTSNDESKTVTSSAVEDDHMNNIRDGAIVNTNNVPKIDQYHEYNDKNRVEELMLGGGSASNNQNVELVAKTDENLSDHQKVESVAKTDEHIDCNENFGKDLQKDEDLEWDEIGDIGDDDEKHVVQGETAKKGELFKRVNIAEDDEDLSWDIEDDDEPVKTTNAM